MNLGKQSLIIFACSIIIFIVAIAFRDKIHEFQSLGLLGIFLINFFGSATLFLPAPAIASVVVGGYLYPPLFVAIASALGSAVGESVGFLLGHAGKNALFHKKHPFWLRIFRIEFNKFGGIIIFLFAFIPNPFFDAIGIMAGIFCFPLYRFVILIFLGRFVRDILLAYLGNAFGIR